MSVLKGKTLFITGGSRGIGLAIALRVADAAIAILNRDARATTGRFFLDEEMLAEAGIADLERCAVKPGTPLLPDLFLG